MRKLNFWVPLQEPKWHSPIRPSIRLRPPPPPRTISFGVTHLNLNSEYSSGIFGI